MRNGEKVGVRKDVGVTDKEDKGRIKSGKEYGNEGFRIERAWGGRNSSYGRGAVDMNEKGGVGGLAGGLLE